MEDSIAKVKKVTSELKLSNNYPFNHYGTTIYIIYLLIFRKSNNFAWVFSSRFSATEFW